MLLILLHLYFHFNVSFINHLPFMVIKYFSFNHLFFQAFFHCFFLFSLFLIAAKCFAQSSPESKREYHFHSHRIPDRPLTAIALSADFVYYHFIAACFFSLDYLMLYFSDYWNDFIIDYSCHCLHLHFHHYFFHHYFYLTFHHHLLQFAQLHLSMS